MTWKFYMPIWLSTSSKLKKLGVVEKVIASIFRGSALQDIQDDDLLLGTRQKITPYGYQVLLLGNTLQLLPNDQAFYPPNSNLTLPSAPNTTLYWSSYLNMYGAIRPGISQIWLQNPYMDTEIVGTIVPDPLDDRLLIYSIDPDTLPQNTLDPVDGVVNPLAVGPGVGLPSPSNGTRYLIVEDMGSTTASSPAWGTVVANSNDIIQYDVIAGQWEVVFDSAAATTVEYVTNLAANVQYRYTQSTWVKSYEGWYNEGDYSIVI
jgi:hypothetical protein